MPPVIIITPKVLSLNGFGIISWWHWLKQEKAGMIVHGALHKTFMKRFGADTRPFGKGPGGKKKQSRRPGASGSSTSLILSGASTSPRSNCGSWRNPARVTGIGRELQDINIFSTIIPIPPTTITTFVIITLMIITTVAVPYTPIRADVGQHRGCSFPRLAVGDTALYVAGVG